MEYIGYIGAHVAGNYIYPMGMLALISQLTKMACISIDYKLCPEYSIKDQVNDVLNVYKYITNYNGFRKNAKVSSNLECLSNIMNSDKIVVSGDSAGANLCGLFLHYLRDNNMNMVKCAWMIAPWGS